MTHDCPVAPRRSADPLSASPRRTARLLAEHGELAWEGPSSAIVSLRPTDDVRCRAESGELRLLAEDIGAAFRGVFAADPWREYLVGADGTRLGFADVFGPSADPADLRELERELDLGLLSEAVGEELRFFWEPEERVQSISRDLAAGSFAQILVTDRGVAGFSWIVRETAGEAFSRRFEPAFGGHLSEGTCLDFLREEGALGPESGILTFAEWGKLPRAGDGRCGYELMRQVLAAASSSLPPETPVAAYTLTGSPVHRILEGIGFRTRYVSLADGLGLITSQLGTLRQTVESLNPRSFALLARDRKGGAPAT